MPALESISRLITVRGMKNRNRERQANLAVRVKHSAITENQLQKSFFHIFDLLGLDQNLVPRPLRKRLEGLPCNQKGGMHN